MLERYSYIVVEGPIGVGKSSLARLLSDKTGARLLHENAGENPFLARFYEDVRRHALATQLFFLFQRAQQVQELAQYDMFAERTVADFLLDKDMLFARMTLDDDEFRLYQQIYEHLKPKTPRPDLVIYLQAPAETLVERVRRRGIRYEQGISEAYLRRVADSYARFFYDYDAAPLLIVNTENLNFVERPEDFQLLLDKVSNMRSAREFFNRAG